MYDIKYRENDSCSQTKFFVSEYIQCTNVLDTQVVLPFVAHRDILSECVIS